MPQSTVSSTESVIPTRTRQTNAYYLVRGQAITDDAIMRHPDAFDAVDALSRRCSDIDWKLRAATTRTYKAFIGRLVEAEVETGRCEPVRAAEAMEQISEALLERRGRPTPQTSAKKLKSLAPEQLEIIIADLGRRHIKGEADPIDVALRRLIEVGAYVGLRPCEWVRGRIVGRTLVVLNAKHTNGRAAGRFRLISLERLPDGLVVRLAHFLALAKKLLAEHGCWEKVHRVLAERLARICARLGLPRVSPYTLRHTAIASWKRARLDRVTIAAMAGHISTKTASRHYAPAKYGWKPEFVYVSARDRTISAVQSASPDPRRTAIPPPWSPPESWANQLPTPF